MKKLLAATAFAALFAAVPAIAAENSTDNMPPSPQSSGPGVKGDTGNKNGPAAKPLLLNHRNVKQRRHQHRRTGNVSVARRDWREGRTRQHQWPVRQEARRHRHLEVNQK